MASASRARRYCSESSRIVGWGPQLLVAQHGLERVQVGIGAQHEDAVEPLLFLDPFGVNCEMIFADRLEVAAVAGVADKSLVALRELTLQGGEDRDPIGGILFRLLMVAADDVASPGQHDRL